VSAGAELSPALRALLDDKLDTLEKLEVVLALADAPSATASVADLALQLQVGHEVLRQVVDEIARSGLVAVAEDAVTLRATAEEQPLLAQAANIYAHNRHEMMRIMTRVGMERIRRMAARTFADAFQIRRKKKDRGPG
jgi:hypothetical protein